jgi:hypothetical protein
MDGAGQVTVVDGLAEILIVKNLDNNDYPWKLPGRALTAGSLPGVLLSFAMNAAIASGGKIVCGYSTTWVWDKPTEHAT